MLHSNKFTLFFVYILHDRVTFINMKGKYEKRNTKDEKCHLTSIS